MISATDLIMRELLLWFILCLNLVILAKIRIPIIQIVVGFFTFAIAFTVPSSYGYPYINLIVFTLAMIQEGYAFKNVF